MTLVWISRGTLGGGMAVADKLARALGCPCVSREELAEKASQAGIPVGKLEMAVAKRRRLNEEFVAQKDRYGAFVVRELAERMQEGNVVYHGRTGQALLPGVSHVLRVRVISDQADRTARAMKRLNLPREKAERYIDEIDDDRRRWVHALYGIDWTDPSEYDAVINLSRMSVDNAAVALLALVQLPEFRPTPASRKRVADLAVGARCRLALGAHPDTRSASVTIVADGDQVAVTYLPRDRDVADAIPKILEEQEGVGSVRCTMAATSILWIQERFDPAASSLDQLVSIASSWGAAIELARFVAAPEAAVAEANGDGEEGAGTDANGTAPTSLRGQAEPAGPREPVGGVIDDTADEEPDSGDDGGLGETLDVLVQAGCAGGAWQIHGDANDLVERIGRATPYAIAVVGSVGLQKGPAVQKRMARELGAQLAASLHVPVVGTDELGEQLLFGPRQWLRLLVTAAVAAGALWSVFVHQQQVVAFLVRDGLANRLLAVAALALCVPLFAFVYGTCAQYLLRLFRFQ